MMSQPAAALVVAAAIAAIFLATNNFM